MTMASQSKGVIIKGTGMRPIPLLRTSLFILLLLLHLPHAHAGEAVTWAVADYDPYIILSGPDKGKGISDEIIRLLIKNIDGYDHRILVTENVLRALNELRSGRNVCTTPFLKTPERDAYLYYSSVPATISPAPGIVVKKKTLHKMGKGKKLSLEKLLENKKLILGITEGRSYTKGIDELLRRFKGQKNIESRVGGDVYKGLMLMLKADRVDYIIGTPLETYHLAREHGMSKDITFVPVKEGSEYFMGYVACAKTQTGMEVIQNVNSVLIRHRPSAEYRSFFERWMPKEMLRDYRKAYDSLFLTIK
jgi:uncharacterized protein (TIGR02285 family)